VAGVVEVVEMTPGEREGARENRGVRRIEHDDRAKGSGTGERSWDRRVAVVRRLEGERAVSGDASPHATDRDAVDLDP
jgi:hypothetical protein